MVEWCKSRGGGQAGVWKRALPGRAGITSDGDNWCYILCVRRKHELDGKGCFELQGSGGDGPPDRIVADG